MMVGSQTPAVGPYQSLLGCLSLRAFRPRHLGRDVFILKDGLPLSLCCPTFKLLLVTVK